MKLNYILIPIYAFLVATIGGWLTNTGMDWYKTIKLPSFTPPGAIIGAVWTTIFILSAISALIVWNMALHNNRFWLIIGIFILNGIINVTWSLLFFNQHFLFTSIIDAAFIGVSVIALILLIWPLSRPASFLLFPYAGWVSFATYLNYLIWTLNK